MYLLHEPLIKGVNKKTRKERFSLYGIRFRCQLLSEFVDVEPALVDAEDHPGGGGPSHDLRKLLKRLRIKMN